MSRLNRREFVKIAGGGIAALGAGMRIPGSARAAQSGGAKTKKEQKAVDSRWSDWEFYYPGKYDEEDAKILKEFQAELEEISKKGKGININDVISGKVTGVTGTEFTTRCSYSNMMSIANINVPNNPLFTDKEYGNKTKYGSMIAFPLISTPEIMPAMPKAKGIGDYMVVSAHNDTSSYYKPFYEGDTLYPIVMEQRCTDVTPAEGSYYRTFVMSGWAKVYNQKGELVSEAANVLKESFRRHKDKSKRNSDGAHAWESPDWWTRPIYQYTDKDWDNIIGMWKREAVRGAEPLYWDEVKVGDEPTPTANFFIMDSTSEIAMSIPQFSIDIRKNVLDPKVFPTMVKNSQGIWVLPEYKEKKARGGPGGGGPGGAGGPGGGEMPGGGGGPGGPGEGEMPGGGGPGGPGGGDMPGGGQGMPQGEGDQGPGGPGGQGGAQQMEAMPTTEQIANRDGRALVQNSLAAKFAAGMICNWMGDAGWLQRFHWDIMELPPGSLDYIDFDEYPTLIPSIPMELRPDLFDKYPYMDKVPYMRGCRAAWHAMEGDLIISKAYVTKKFNIGSDYFVDLTWWCQSYDNYLIEEGSATVKLPKR